jgi:hypothetical protein
MQDLLFSPLRCASIDSSSRRPLAKVRDCEGKQGKGNTPERNRIIGRIGTEHECDRIVVLGRTGTPNELSYVQTCVGESFNRVLMGGVATRESKESGTMGYE